MTMSPDGALDTIARGLARGMSRREALRTGGAALVATVAASPADALARVTGHCPHHRVKCNGKCCPPGEVCLHPKKRKHHRRPKPRCGCRPGSVRCKGKCVHIKSDVHNCGRCGHRCARGQQCKNGKCIHACPPGEAFCNGACISVLADPRNCGACGHKCNGVCHQGACLNQCPSGFTECAGGCVSLASDPRNCGLCGSKCPTGNVCVNGVCSSGCAEGEIKCGGLCKALSSDPDNCGTCGSVCGSNQACVRGVCTSSCPSGEKLCGRYCVDPQGNAQNCGKCGITCAADQICASAQCVSASTGCPSGEVNCSGSCAPGTGCCAGAPQTQHTTGLGQSFYDCNPQGAPGNDATYSRQLAQEAAAAFAPGQQQYFTVCPDTGANVIEVNRSDGSWAVFAYTGATAGYVHGAGAPYCPSTTDPTWY